MAPVPDTDLRNGGQNIEAKPTMHVTYEQISIPIAESLDRVNRRSTVRINRGRREKGSRPFLTCLAWGCHDANCSSARIPRHQRTHAHAGPRAYLDHPSCKMADFGGTPNSSAEGICTCCRSGRPSMHVYAVRCSLQLNRRPEPRPG